MLCTSVLWMTSLFVHNQPGKCNANMAYLKVIHQGQHEFDSAANAVHHCRHCSHPLATADKHTCFYERWEVGRAKVCRIWLPIWCMLPCWVN